MFALQILLGFVLLIGSAEILVRGAVALAHRIHVSPMIIGLTIVAYGTTMPELVVSLEAARNGAVGVAIGNVVGSNIANILLILGIAAVIAPIPCEGRTMRREGVVAIFAAFLLAALALDGKLAPWHGIGMIALLVGLTFWSVRRDRRQRRLAAEISKEELPKGPSSLPAAGGRLLGGVVGIRIGAPLLVDGAVTMAQILGVSDAVIGLTVVAVGTSLPELATAVVAARRGDPEVALGNILGANTYNIMFILGLVAIIAPVTIPPSIAGLDIWLMLIVTLVFAGSALLTGRISRGLGIGFLLAYGAYTTYQYTGAA
ncbi:MAG: calcium/sodium antiporter [Alphaproteobacteria bacterium]